MSRRKQTKPRHFDTEVDGDAEQRDGEWWLLFDRSGGSSDRGHRRGVDGRTDADGLLRDNGATLRALCFSVVVYRRHRDTRADADTLGAGSDVRLIGMCRTRTADYTQDVSMCGRCARTTLLTVPREGGTSVSSPARHPRV